jgi:hypothetical protein
VAVANHARYYRIPNSVTYSRKIGTKEIIEKYNILLKNNSLPELKENYIYNGRCKNDLKKEYIKMGYPKPLRFSSNITFELLDIVLKRIINEKIYA